MPVYDFAQFPAKLHEIEIKIEKNWFACVWRDAPGRSPRSATSKTVYIHPEGEKIATQGEFFLLLFCLLMDDDVITRRWRHVLRTL